LPNSTRADGWVGDGDDISDGLTALVPDEWPRHDGSMAVKAIGVDDAGTHYLLIGLNRENIDALLRGEVLWLDSGAVPLNEDSDIVLVFAETDEELDERFPPRMPPV
jgi:hypothetical protein